MNRHIKKSLFCTAAFLAIITPITNLFAYDWVVTAHVTTIEGSYAPNSVPFIVDVSGGTCTAGQFLNWLAQGSDTASKVASVQSVLSLLITAKSTGQRVVVYGNNTGCTVSNIWIQ